MLFLHVQDSVLAGEGREGGGGEGSDEIRGISKISTMEGEQNWKEQNKGVVKIILH